MHVYITFIHLLCLYYWFINYLFMSAVTARWKNLQNNANIIIKHFIIEINRFFRIDGQTSETWAREPRRDFRRKSSSERREALPGECLCCLLSHTRCFFSLYHDLFSFWCLLSALTAVWWVLHSYFISNIIIKQHVKINTVFLRSVSVLMTTLSLHLSYNCFYFDINSRYCHYSELIFRPLLVVMFLESCFLFHFNHLYNKSPLHS